MDYKKYMHKTPLWGVDSAMSAKPLHRGRGWGGSPLLFYSELIHGSLCVYLTGVEDH